MDTKILQLEWRPWKSRLICYKNFIRDNGVVTNTHPSFCIEKKSQILRRFCIWTSDPILICSWPLFDKVTNGLTPSKDENSLLIICNISFDRVNWRWEKGRILVLKIEKFEDPLFSSTFKVWESEVALLLFNFGSGAVIE